MYPFTSGRRSGGGSAWPPEISRRPLVYAVLGAVRIRDPDLLLPINCPPAVSREGKRLDTPSSGLSAHLQRAENRPQDTPEMPSDLAKVVAAWQ